VQCGARFAADPTKRFLHVPSLGPADLPVADLAISLDVIFHLLEDDIYQEYMTRLCAAAGRYLIIYSSDKDELPEWAEVRHRRFSRWIRENRPDLTLIEKIHNPYPFDRTTAWTSFSDFYVFAKRPAAC